MVTTPNSSDASPESHRHSAVQLRSDEAHLIAFVALSADNFTHNALQQEVVETLKERV